MARNPDPAVYTWLYEVARNSVARQERSLDELRSRTGLLFSAASVVAAFLGAAAADDGWGLAGILGIGAFVLCMACCLACLMPVPGWHFRPSVQRLFDDYVEADDPADLASILRDLAYFDMDSITSNERRLSGLFWAFRAAVVLLLVQVLLLLYDLPR